MAVDRTGVTQRLAVILANTVLVDISLQDIIFWGNSPSNKLAFKIQKRIIRILTHSLQTTSCRPLFKELNIMPLPCVHIFETIMFVKQDMFQVAKFFKQTSRYTNTTPITDCILCAHILSLNKNVTALETFIVGLNLKPNIKVCSEIWNLNNFSFCQLPGYKIYYKGSHMNVADGNETYIRQELEEETEILDFGNIKIMNFCTKLTRGENLSMTALNRCHDLPKAEFLIVLKNT